MKKNRIYLILAVFIVLAVVASTSCFKPSYSSSSKYTPKSKLEIVKEGVREELIKQANKFPLPVDSFSVREYDSYTKNMYEVTIWLKYPGGQTTTTERVVWTDDSGKIVRAPF